MPAITELPCEVIASIIRNLDNLRFLPPTLLACRHFYTSFKQYNGIEAAIFRRQVTPDLVPYSIAVLEASRLPRPYVEDSVRGLLDGLHDQRPRLAARLPTMPTSLVRRMARTHDVIHGLATDFAASAWAYLAQTPGSDRSPSASTNISLSPSEYFRLCRAFYRLELFYCLFRSAPGEVSTPLAVPMDSWFFSRYSPWEMEQLGSVHDFLEEKLSKASYDVVAHDVEFGEVKIDYLSPAMENYWRQLWLSQGVDFIYQLMTANSYEVKRSLLASAFDSGFANLPECLEAVLDTYSNQTLNAAEECSKDQLQSLISSGDYDDTDNGPFEAWYAGHASLPAGAWAMIDDNDWLRRRAYVFWDWDRIQSNDLLPVFESVSDQPSSDYTSHHFEEMQESFNERSKIWQMGGSGYWSKGDTSRIKYRLS
ncbi:hypothetical protein F5X97DRAFT_311726 [Nemania serpens]|nr:hypothetical protein F5X97DRAFT_311726 [Nemania serpens]